MVTALPRAALAPALLLFGCNAAFDPQYLVKDLRILAVRAEVVGAAPLADGDLGDVVRLEALVANPAGLSPVAVRWKACLPASGTAVPPCLDARYLADPDRLDAAPGVLDLGTGTSVEVPVPPELAPYFQLLVDRASADPVYACTLYAEVPVVAVAAAGAERRVAVKRVRLGPFREVAGTPLDGAYVPNRNPALDAVLAAAAGLEPCSGAPAARTCGTSADCGGPACNPDPSGGPGQCDDPRPPAGATLCAAPAPGSAQLYNQCRGDGTRTELAEPLDYQWYVSAGSFDGPAPEKVSGSGNVTDRAPSFWPPAGPFTLWVVLRDGRGGIGWLRRDFR